MFCARFFSGVRRESRKGGNGEDGGVVVRGEAEGGEVV